MRLATALPSLAARDAVRASGDPLVITALGLEPRYLPPAALYLDPRGRIGRAVFWRHGVLALLILDVVGIALLQIAGYDAETAQAAVYLLLLWPALALSIKRWHDIDRTGWWVLVNLVPAVGQLIALVVNGAVRGTRGPNRFGPDPLV